MTRLSKWLQTSEPQVIGDLHTLPKDDEQDGGQACPSCGYRLRFSDAYFFGWRRGPEGLVYTICPRCGADWPD